MAERASRIDDGSPSVPTAAGPQLIADAALPSSTISASTRWSDDGNRLFVQRAVDPRWSPWLHEHRADIGTVAVAFGVAIACVVIVRTLRRPRRPGRRYCRRCNYDLTAGHGEHLDRCPECGRAASRVVVGRRWPWRLAPVVLPAVALAIAGAVAWSSGVSLRPDIPTSAAWPFASCGTWSPRWPLWRTRSRVQPQREIDVYTLADDVFRRVRTITLGTSWDWRATADGSLIAWSEQSERTDWGLTVQWIEVDSGRHRSIFVGHAQSGFVAVSGFTPDERAIVATRVGLVYGEREQTRTVPLDALLIDRVTGALRRLGTTSVGVGGATGMGWSLPLVGAAVGGGPTIDWVAFAIDQRQSTMRDVVAVTSSGLRPVSLEPHTLTPLTWFADRPRLVDDRVLRLGERFAVDLHTGSVVQRPMPAMQRAWFRDGFAGDPSPDGRHAASVVVTSKRSGTRPAYRLQVWRRGKGPARR